VRLAETARTSRYLSLLERQRIATLRGRGHGVREIARRTGRSPSTISRGLRRNPAPPDNDVYDGDLALRVPGSGHDGSARRVLPATRRCGRSSSGSFLASSWGGGVSAGERY
jgi:hypothetical protein